jgi:hypothetical protein
MVQNDRSLVSNQRQRTGEDARHAQPRDARERFRGAGCRALLAGPRRRGPSPRLVAERDRIGRINLGGRDLSNEQPWPVLETVEELDVVFFARPYAFEFAAADHSALKSRPPAPWRKSDHYGAHRDVLPSGLNLKSTGRSRTTVLFRLSGLSPIQTRRSCLSQAVPGNEEGRHD